MTALRSGKRKIMEKKNNLNRGGYVFIPTERTKEQLAEEIRENVTQISRPSIMDNKTEVAGAFYGGVEGNQVWVVQNAKHNSEFVPQRLYTGVIGQKDGKTVLAGKFGFVRGFHLMWVVCTIIGVVAMLMMVQNTTVAAVIAAICVACWIGTAVSGCVRYKEEEKAVRALLQELCAGGAEEEPAVETEEEPAAGTEDEPPVGVEEPAAEE